MYDISTPTESYQKEISKLKVQIKAVDNNSELNSGRFLHLSHLSSQYFGLWFENKAMGF